jgi:hypothetical protein
LSVLSEDSSFSLEVMPLLEWQVATRKNTLVVSVFSEALGKTKSFETDLALETSDYSKSLSEKTIVFLSRNGNKLLVNSNP